MRRVLLTFSRATESGFQLATLKRVFSRGRRGASAAAFLGGVFSCPLGVSEPPASAADPVYSFKQSLLLSLLAIMEAALSNPNQDLLYTKENKQRVRLTQAWLVAAKSEIAEDMSDPLSLLPSDHCVKRRRRCSGLQPCELCTEAGVECLFSREAKRRGPPKGFKPGGPTKAMASKPAPTKKTQPAVKIEHERKIDDDEDDGDFSPDDYSRKTSLPQPSRLEPAQQFREPDDRPAKVPRRASYTADHAIVGRVQSGAFSAAAEHFSATATRPASENLASVHSNTRQPHFHSAPDASAAAAAALTHFAALANASAYHAQQQPMLAHYRAPPDHMGYQQGSYSYDSSAAVSAAYGQYAPLPHQVPRVAQIVPPHMIAVADTYLPPMRPYQGPAYLPTLISPPLQSPITPLGFNENAQQPYSPQFAVPTSHLDLNSPSFLTPNNLYADSPSSASGLQQSLRAGIGSTGTPQYKTGLTPTPMDSAPTETKDYFSRPPTSASDSSRGSGSTGSERSKEVETDFDRFRREMESKPPVVPQGSSEVPAKIAAALSGKLAVADEFEEDPGQLLVTQRGLPYIDYADAFDGEAGGFQVLAEDGTVTVVSPGTMLAAIEANDGMQESYFPVATVATPLASPTFDFSILRDVDLPSSIPDNPSLFADLPPMPPLAIITHLVLSFPQYMDSLSTMFHRTFWESIHAKPQWLLLSMAALVAPLCEDLGPTRFGIGNALLERARRMMLFVGTSGGREAVAALFFCGVATSTTWKKNSGSLMDTLMNMTVSTARSLRLNVEKEEEEKQARAQEDWIDREMDRRVWWTVYMMDVIGG